MVYKCVKFERFFKQWFGHLSYVNVNYNTFKWLSTLTHWHTGLIHTHHTPTLIHIHHTVPFRSICQPLWCVTHLTKIWLCQVAEMSLTSTKFLQAVFFFFSKLVSSHFNFQNIFLLSKRFRHFTKMTVTIITFCQFLRARDVWLMNWQYPYPHIVCDMGNPWVVFTLSVPIPVKTRTHVHGYGFSRVSSWVQIRVHYPRIWVCM